MKSNLFQGAEYIEWANEIHFYIKCNLSLSLSRSLELSLRNQRSRTRKKHFINEQLPILYITEDSSCYNKYYKIY